MKLYSYTQPISAAIQFTDNLSPAQDLKDRYGSLYSEHPMGYNFDLTVSANASQQSKIKKITKDLHDKYDHSLINNLDEFSGQVPTFEILALAMLKYVSKNLDGPEVVVRLGIDNKNWVEVKSSNEIKLTKSYKINCVHRHHNPNLSAIENKKLYGKCSEIHGHEYTVEVSLCGGINEHGVVISSDYLDKLVGEHLILPFNKTYLNDIMGNTSGELISELFYKKMKPMFPGNLKFDLTLRETRKNSFVKLM